jgi:hypothetical protein
MVIVAAAAAGHRFPPSLVSFHFDSMSVVVKVETGCLCCL